MSDLFSGLGRKAASAIAKAKWTFTALTGTEEEALLAEKELGAHMGKAFLEDVPLTDDRELSQLVHNTGEQLAGWISNRQREFTFACIAMPEPNAIALPGGYIFISVGLVELCENDTNWLAGLIGHEIGHVVKNHAFERAVASKLVQMLSQGAMFGGPIKRAAMGMVANLLSKGYSEDQEFEADVFGVKLSHSAGFHASGLMRFLQTVDTAGTGIHDVAFLDSHPKPTDRISNLRDSIG